jgi:uncharacterized protein (TIGR02001 family)
MDVPCRRLLLFIGFLAAPALSAAVGLDDFGGSLGLTSDDIYHGISLTCGDPAAQGDIHYRSAGGDSASEFFAGVWGSAGLGQSSCGEAREFNAYGGYSFPVGQDFGATLSYTHYGYPGGSYTFGRFGGYRYDYDALEAQWAWQDRVSVTVSWTPDASRFVHYSPERDRTALSYGLQLHQPVLGGLTASGGVGYDEIEDPTGVGYAFWNAGLGYAVGPVQLQAGYVGTASRAVRLFGSYVAGNRAFASVMWRF